MLEEARGTIGETLFRETRYLIIGRTLMRLPCSQHLQGLRK
jgi:hypothetical protein